MKRMVKIAILLVSVAVLSLSSVPAWATATAEADGQVRTPTLHSGPSSFESATSSTSSVSVTASYTNDEGSPGTMMAYANGGNSPSLSLSGSATSTLGNYYLYPNYDSIVSTGHSQITYWYQVTGPSSVSVPLVYSFASSYSASTGTGGTTGGDGYLSFLPGTYRFSWGVDSYGSDESLLGSHVVDGTVATGQWYRVYMYLDLYVGENDHLWIWGTAAPGPALLPIGSTRRSRSMLTGSQTTPATRSSSIP